MNSEDKKAAASAFIASINDQAVSAVETSAVQINGAFNLELALEAAFAAVDKHRIEAAIERLNNNESIVIFDP